MHKIVWDKDLKQARALHRVLVEQKIGRRLKPDEVVHHKNHVKTDNRLNNLQIKPLSDHIRDHRTRYHYCLVKVGKRICRRPHHSRGMCNTHARQFYRKGAMPTLVRKTPLNERHR